MSISEKPAVDPKECSHSNMGGTIRIRKENQKESSDRWLEKLKGGMLEKVVAKESSKKDQVESGIID